jgi:phospho-N-acetylmuramoyl-pentapeptide-transferase
MLPFGLFDFGFFYYILSLIILVGITNCANLTDGIDGLASSVAFAIGISLFYFSYGVSDSSAFISATLSAGALGFLIFNINPARIFMGDTGSLFLGALVGALAFEMENPLIAVVSGCVYVIEGIRVILQVIFFKTIGKRLFKMAPVHHHLEKCGWDENRICIVSIIITLLISTLLAPLCKY